MNSIDSKKILLSVLIFIGVAGTILFFPIDFGGNYTCFYHRTFDQTHPVSDINTSSHLHKGKKNITKSDGGTLHNIEISNNYNEISHRRSVLLDNYLRQYALLWWASVGLLAFCIYLFLKLKIYIRVNKSSLTIK